jgi:hypothetical protein
MPHLFYLAKQCAATQNKLFQLHGQLLEDRSRENVPLVGLIKEKPEYVFKVISSHQSEYNDWGKYFPNLSFFVQSQR